MGLSGIFSLLKKMVLPFLIRGVVITGFTREKAWFWHSFLHGKTPIFISAEDVWEDIKQNRVVVI